MSSKDNVCASIDWRDYRGCEAILGICPRSLAVRGRNLTAMLDAMTPRISAVHVVMCDYLDRYSLDGDGDQALALSKTWQERYFPEIRARFNRVECTDWLTLMQAEGFTERHRTLLALYEANAECRSAIISSAQIYVDAKVQRLKRDGAAFDIQSLEESSRQYMIEEFAGMALYKNFLPNAPEVYWGVYVEDIEIFHRNAGGIDLTLPMTLPVWNSRLGSSIPMVRRLAEAA
jgi:hypothetical protein